MATPAALFPFIALITLGSVWDLSAQPITLEPADRRSDMKTDGAAAALVAGPTRLELASGFSASLWATETMRTDPRAIAFDERGRLFVTETKREELLRGLGVQIGISGHDLHGLVLGPDGRLYFSVGDRGVHLATREGKVLEVRETGAVFRCAQDGSGLELFATGLRNPRDLAFDDLGNLFTGDSEADNGDQARLVHLIDGGDSGWRAGYESATPDHGGPWIREGIWRPRFEDQPAYFLPPICSIGQGPAGLTCYPGTGLPDDYRDTFFLCHINHSPGDSRIQTYSLEPAGAGFSLADSRLFVRGAMPTDVTFGPDNRLYFSDWVSGWPWPKSGRGQIHAIAPTNLTPAAREASEETRRLLASGTAGLAPAALADLLGHADRRVRLAAQFELAARGEPSLSVYRAVAENPAAPRLARLHAIWGMGQLANRVAAALNPALPLLEDRDPEVRAQSAMMLGDYFRIEAFRGLRAALKDPAPRVAFFAAQSLGKVKRVEAIPTLLDLLRRNADRDLVLRHGIVIALARLGPDPALANAFKDPSRSVRLGALLAYRRLNDAAVATFLNDDDPTLVREAARAINDLPIESVLPALAALLDSVPFDDEALTMRVLNAHARLGLAENAKALADFAGRAQVPTAFRAAALRHLAAWPTPPQRDPVTGLHRPFPPRDPQPAKQVFGDFLSRMAGKVPEEVQIATVQTVAALKVPGTGHALWDLVYQDTRPIATRVAALQALEALDDLRLEVAAQHSAGSEHVELRLAAIPVLGRRLPAVSLPSLETLARNGTAEEQRRVYALLATLQHPRADALCLEALHRLAAGEIPLAAQAELIETASQRSNQDVADALAQLMEKWNSSRDRLDPFRSTLEGGDPAAGRRLFERNPALACIQCHDSGGEMRGSGTLAPTLAAIAPWRTTEQLLRSILFPDAEITPGFERLQVRLGDGRIETGRLMHESESELCLFRDDGSPVVLSKAQIVHRESQRACMPGDVSTSLTRMELRDLVAYVSAFRTIAR